jgi:hypothetical protein
LTKHTKMDDWEELADEDNIQVDEDINKKFEDE